MAQSGNPRNVHIYSNTQEEPQLMAGFLQLGRTTVSELYDCLEICFEEPAAGQFRLSDSTGAILSRATPDIIVPIRDYSVISLRTRPSTLPLISSGSSYLS
jgi:hypothetical protein